MKPLLLLFFFADSVLSLAGFKIIFMDAVTPDNIPATSTVWWIIILALSSAITALVVYIRKSHTLALEGAQKNNAQTVALVEKYNDKIEDLMIKYLKDDRDVIEKSTRAFEKHSDILDTFGENLKEHSKNEVKALEELSSLIKQQIVESKDRGITDQKYRNSK